MSLKTVFIINATLTGFISFVSLLLPATLISWYGVESSSDIVLMVRIFGCALLAIALMTFYLKNAEYNSNVKSVVLALLLSNSVGTIVAFWGQVSNVGTNTFGWSTVILYGFLSLAYLSIYFKN